jgi:hypothetical protein
MNRGYRAVPFLLLSALPVLAQTFGEITGHVRDQSGASVPNASITITNVSTNAGRSTVSTSAGDYSYSFGAARRV